MAVVVDTSLALAWFLPDERSAEAMHVLDELVEGRQALLVPPLWLPETSNAVVTAVRRGRLTEAQAQRCVELLAQLPVEIDPHPSGQRELVAASLRHGLSAYDATYLLLAARNGAPLATLDAGLAEAARAAGVDVLP